MKKILIIAQIMIIAYISSGCVLLHLRREPGRRYYQGYIYTLEGQPIQGLKVYSSDCKYLRCTEADSAVIITDARGKVYSSDCKNFRCTEAYSAGRMTDERGYFKFKQAKHWMTGYLVVESDGRIIDFIDLCRFGRPVLHWMPFPWQKDPLLGCFDERSTDTFFVDMDCKWKSDMARQGQKRETKRILRKSVALANCLPDTVEPSFGTFTDERDGKTYKTVKIGEQTWMAQNLNYKTDSSWCFNNADSNCIKYGRLYTWDAAMEICPIGYHLPSSEDWGRLVATAGGWKTAAKKLKSKSGWDENGNGTDNYEFSALPSGFRYSGDDFSSAGYHGHWWTATECTDNYAYYWFISYDIDNVYEGDDFKDYGFSVRCVADRP